MEKNWLIRTKSNHILGPVSKEKVLELFKNNSIKADDELCTGNGYWFFVRESELVERYLLGKESQGFNPISEAKDVLTSTKHEAPPVEEDITLLTSLPKSSAAARAELEIPATPREEALVEITTAKKKVKRNTVQPQSGQTQKNQLKKQSYLSYIGLAGLLLLVLMIYYRKSIMQKLFDDDVSLVSAVISSAYAQDDVPKEKKNSLKMWLPLEN